MNHQPLAGRTALITGATGDIGRAVTDSLVARGARVFAVDLAEAILSRSPTDRPEVTWLKGDVRDEGSVVSFVGEALRSAGRIDVLINNAGVEGVLRPIIDTDVADLEKVLSVNVVGVFLCMKHVIPHMSASGSGSIVNMASTAGLAATPNAAAYIASKHAVIGLTRAAAAECAADNVRVNCVAPGPIEGRMMGSILSGLGEVGDLVRKRIPSGRFGTPDEVASVVAFLASDDARHIHGAVLPVDGGRTAV